MADWSPTQYLAFADERARPAADLIAQVAHLTPRVIVDLGCGPGNSTAMLRAAFPNADITGIDLSPAMIDKARTSGVAAIFETADVQLWNVPGDVELIFSNALFQWIPEHGEVLRRIFYQLGTGGVMAVQMPDNLSEPSHAEMSNIASAAPWRGKLERAAQSRSTIGSAANYYELLAPLATKVDIWRTTYHHPMDGHQGIVDMLSTTGLKPYLDALDEVDRAAYLGAYKKALELHYSTMANQKVLLAFPRLFVVASRGDK